MKKFRITVDGKTYEVEVEEVKGGSAEQERPVRQASPATPAPAPRPVSKARTAPGKGKVTAPMPGTVIKLLASEGDKVEAGQTVAILEAMKMENNINANASGTVVSINVQPGQNVDSGQLLLTIE